MALFSRFGASAGLIAALSMASTPAFAAELPQGMVKQAQGSAMFAEFDNSPFNTTTIDGDTEIAEWRGRGWRRGRWRRGRIRGGDVLAGVLILGGIAAVASAANNNRRRDRDVVIVDRDRNRDRDERRDNRDRRNNGSRGLDSAVDQCVDRIQQDVRVDSVDGVDRTAQGWIVTGSLFNGSGFTCAIDNNGKIDAIDYGDLGRGNLRGISAPGQVEDNQWDDERYIAARQSQRGPQPYRTTTVQQARSDQPLVPLSSTRQPAYPGGPLPGDE